MFLNKLDKNEKRTMEYSFQLTAIGNIRVKNLMC